MVNESTQRRWKNGIVGYTGKVSLDPINLTPFKGEYPSVRDCLWNIHISYWLWLFVEVGGLGKVTSVPRIVCRVYLCDSERTKAFLKRCFYILAVIIKRINTVREILNFSSLTIVCFSDELKRNWLYEKLIVLSGSSSLRSLADLRERSSLSSSPTDSV